jgi:hypothetical protein
MKSRQRRLKAIELSLTPQQIEVVWLRDALHAGTLEEGARHSPPYRGVVANAVFRTVTESMKGQPEELIERSNEPSSKRARRRISSTDSQLMRT